MASELKHSDDYGPARGSGSAVYHRLSPWEIFVVDCPTMLDGDAVTPSEVTAQTVSLGAHQERQQVGGSFPDAVQLQ